MGKYVLSLDEIAELKRPALFDVSAFLSVMGQKRNGFSFEDKFSFCKRNCDFYVSMRNKVSEDSYFFITMRVYENLYSGGYYRYKRQIKKPDFFNSHRDVLALGRKRREEGQERRRLAQAFFDNEKIISFDEEEQSSYDLFYRRYWFVRKECKLTDADYDFVLSGVVLAKLRFPIDLMSNDMGSLYAKKDLSEREKIRRYNFRFFIRTGKFRFEKRA